MEKKSEKAYIVLASLPLQNCLAQPDSFNGGHVFFMKNSYIYHLHFT